MTPSMNERNSAQGQPSPWVRLTTAVLRPQVMQLIGDVCAVIIAVFTYQVAREHMIVGWKRFPIAEEFVIGLFASGYFAVVYWLGGLYKDFFIRSPLEELWLVAKSTFIGSALFFLALTMSSGDYFRQNPRLVFVVFWLLVTICVGIGRTLSRILQRSLREHRIIQIRALLYGTANECSSLLDDLRNQPSLGYSVQGALLSDADHWQRTDVVAIPEPESLTDFMQQADVDEILIAMRRADHDRLLMVAAVGSNAGMRVKIVPDLYDMFSGQVRTLQIYGSGLIDVHPQLLEPWQDFVKRVIDVVVSLTVLVLGLPIWIATGVLVKLSSRGPMFYAQDRVGRNGKVFKMFKFRSMYVDEHRKPSWTTVNDPRVTPIGRFIRKSHIDEIPQLFNVLRGEMSLVGPRPEVPYFVEKFSDVIPYYRRRLKVRPGVTGWWQVKYKAYSESVEEIENRLKYDFFYIENMSVRLDIEILFRTIIVMLRGHGQA